MATQVFRLAGRKVVTTYTDAVDLRALGSLKVARASEVEFDNDYHGWTVKLAGLDEYLGPGYLTPDRAAACHFPSRAAALKAEVVEINRRLRAVHMPEVISHEGKDAEVLY